MKQTRILLLDLSPASGLGDGLRGILEAAVSQDVQLHQEPVGGGGPAVGNGDLARMIERWTPDMIFLVFSTSLLKPAQELVESMRRASSERPIVVVMESGGPDEVMELLNRGASDFITPPLEAIDVLPRLWRLLEHARRADPLTHKLKAQLGLKQFIGESPGFLAEIKKIPLVARCDASVLIRGETGTGKELCARAVHYLSRRADKPFVPVNCGAIPVELVENELFGHERGAFTGAATTQPGLIGEADGGTLFLDEIDCLPLLAQVKLLRFLQEKVYRPLGSTKMQPVDVRLIAATNINLEEAVREGKFRQDLYYRLNIIPLALPPLRERREDIPALARHFLAKYAAEFERPAMEFSLEAMQKLLLHDWPGNVRELEHAVERAVVLSEQVIIQDVDIDVPGAEADGRPESFQEAKAKVIAQFEKTYIEGLLLAHQGNISQAAHAAQKNRRAFWQLVHKHRIDARSFKSTR
jgi:DNA-binding NtrC family response regulator